MRGVATPYIIALILGILVIGLLGFIFFGKGLDTTKTGNEQICGAKKSAYCQQWSLTNYVIEPSGGWENYASECKVLIPSVSQSDCKSLPGFGTSTTTKASQQPTSCSSDAECGTGFSCWASLPAGPSPGIKGSNDTPGRCWSNEIVSKIV